MLLGEEPKLQRAGFRYGFLAFILALIILSAFAVFASSNHHYIMLICPVMLLFNHLAFQFRWSRRVTIGLRTFAVSLTTLGSLVIFYNLFTRRWL